MEESRLTRDLVVKVLARVSQDIRGHVGPGDGEGDAVALEGVFLPLADDGGVGDAVDALVWWKGVSVGRFWGSWRGSLLRAVTGASWAGAAAAEETWSAQTAMAMAVLMNFMVLWRGAARWNW